MHKLINIAVSITMTSLFAVMFWGQVGLVASAVARSKTGSYAVTPNQYLQIKILEPVY
jgi:hypothetical protein